MTPTNLTIETSGLGKVISKIATITTELPYGGLEGKLVNYYTALYIFTY